MALPVRALSPGWARGTVHRSDDPLRWDSGRPGPEVLVLPALWWPPFPSLPSHVIAAALLGVPAVRPSPGPIPVVAGVDPDLLREGETVEVNGSKGTLAIAGVREVEVVTAFLERGDGRILLLERSSKVGSFRGRWAGVSGFLEAPTPLEQAYREVEEETGLARGRLELRASGDPVLARHEDTVYVVHPFRFGVGSVDVRLDWEHVRCEWVDPSEVRRRSTVPKLDLAWESVARAPAPKG